MFFALGIHSTNIFSAAKYYISIVRSDEFVVGACVCVYVNEITFASGCKMNNTNHPYEKKKHRHLKIANEKPMKHIVTIILRKFSDASLKMHWIKNHPENISHKIPLKQYKSNPFSIHTFTFFTPFWKRSVKSIPVMCWMWSIFKWQQLEHHFYPLSTSCLAQNTILVTLREKNKNLFYSFIFPLRLLSRLTSNEILRNAIKRHRLA